MVDVNNSVTRQIIKKAFERINGEERDDLDFTDVFFPKLCAIYGAELCLALNEGKNIDGILSKRGLSKNDFITVDNMMNSGINYVSQNNNSLTSIFDAENAYNDTLKKYAESVLKHLEKSCDEISIEIIKKALQDSFIIYENVYRPCSDYENKKNRNM